MKETTRVQLELPSASMDRLRTLKEKTEAISYAEVAKNALKVYERLIDLSEGGHTLMVRGPDGKIKEIELFY